MYIVKVSEQQASQLGLTSEIKTVYGLTGVLCHNLSTAKFYCSLYKLPLTTIVDLGAK